MVALLAGSLAVAVSAPWVPAGWGSVWSVSRVPIRPPPVPVVVAWTVSPVGAVQLVVAEVLSDQ